jgi:hypothetical protein
MDADHFDALTKTLSTSRSRRGLARLLGGLSLGGALTALRAPEVAAGSRLGGAPCTKNSQCKTNHCFRSSGTCSCSGTVKCQPLADPCKKAVCTTTNHCGLDPDPPTDDIACGPPGSFNICCGGKCVFGNCCTNQKCTAPETCGGAYPPVKHQCGSCTPATTCPSNQTCGSRDNGCGGTLDCGSCVAGGERCLSVPGGSAIECQCGYAKCPLGTECADFGNHESVCQTGTNDLQCCCFPDGGSLHCAPGSNYICCSGYCAPIAGQTYGQCSAAPS